MVLPTTAFTMSANVNTVKNANNGLVFTIMRIVLSSRTPGVHGLPFEDGSTVLLQK